MDKTLFDDEAKEKVNELRENKIEIYSISKLDTFDNCPLSYNLKYNDRSIREVKNIYSELGSIVHELLEKKSIAWRNKEVFNVDERKVLQDKVDELYSQGVYFPSDKVKDNFVKNMIEFYNKSTFYKEDILYNEKYFLYELDGIYLQGYIDCVLKNRDDAVDVVDFKTSSKYNSESLYKHGRQLLVYKFALENGGFKVQDVYWNMLKYAYVVQTLKNGKDRKTMCQRSQLINDMYTQMYTQMKKFGHDESTFASKVRLACAFNDFDMLPDELKDRYSVEDCMLKYDTDYAIELECKQYIKNTVNKIKNEREWSPRTISEGDTFFCNNLCGVRNSCEYIEDFNKRFEGIIDDSFDELFYGK